jgi:hypothetical protein
MLSIAARNEQTREPAFTEAQLKRILLSDLEPAKLEHSDLKVTKLKEPKLSVVVNEAQWKNGGRSRLGKVLTEMGWYTVDERTYCQSPLMLYEVINCPLCTPVELRLSQYDQRDRRCWSKNGKPQNG